MAAQRGLSWLRNLARQIKLLRGRYATHRLARLRRARLRNQDRPLCAAIQKKYAAYKNYPLIHNYPFLHLFLGDLCFCRPAAYAFKPSDQSALLYVKMIFLHDFPFVKIIFT